MILLDEHLISLGYSRNTAISITGIHKDVYAELSTGDTSAAIQTTVQALVDAYNPLADEKTVKKLELKNEGLSRIQLLFPSISDFDELALVREQWLSMTSASRSPTVEFQKMIDIYSAGLSGISAINALTTVTDVQNYDVVNTPAWP